MPLFDDDTMDQKTIPGAGSFQYSATRPDELQESNYTLVTVAIDFSYSTVDFATYLLQMLKACILACMKNPRNRNIMLRVISFNHEVNEIHGFVPINTIDIDSYDEFEPDGCTALYDAVYSAVGATLDYADDLYQQEFDSVNGVCYIITDGLNNKGTATPTMINNKIKAALKGEELTAFTTVLIQLKDPTAPDIAKIEAELKKFREDADITSFVDVTDVTPEVLAKLGQFISKSISSHSNSLQSGAPINTQSLSI